MSSSDINDRFTSVMGTDRGTTEEDRSELDPSKQHPSQEGHPERFMIDPSLLLTRSGIGWISEEETARSAVISAAFRRAVTEGPSDLLLPFVRRRDHETIGFASEALSALLEPIETFSHESLEDLSPEVKIVRDALLRTERPEAEILADEWVYLATQSWLVAKLKTILSQVRRAGATVVEITARSTMDTRERLIHELISVVIPEAHLPAVLTPGELRKAGVKWVIYGGSLAGATAVPGPLGVLGGALAGRVIRAFDP